MPLSYLRNAALADLIGAPPEPNEPPSVIVQNLLRHAMSDAISEGIINVFMVTNSHEANIQLTAIHENIFVRKYSHAIRVFIWLTLIPQETPLWLRFGGDKPFPRPWSR